MAFIITVANAKGGVGKSTITYGLACHYTARGAKCAILDEDIQQTISDNLDMFNEREDPINIDLIDKDKLSSYKALSEMEEYDMILIDTPPVLTTQLGDIYDISDMVLIPIKPSTDDYNSLMRSIGTLRDVMKRNKDLIVAIVLNMTVSNSNVQESFRASFDDEKRIKVLKTEVVNRVIHTKYKLYANSIFKTKDTGAKAEMAALGDEIYYLITL